MWVIRAFLKVIDELSAFSSNFWILNRKAILRGGPVDIQNFWPALYFLQSCSPVDCAIEYFKVNHKLNLC